MDKQIIENIGILCPTILCLGLIVGIVFYKNLSPIYKHLVFYLMFMFLFEQLSRLLGYYGSNFIILPLYSLLELIFFSYLYHYFFLNKNKKLLLIITSFAILYIIFEFILHFVINNTNTKEFQPYAKVVDNFIIIVMALVYYLEKAKKFKIDNKNVFELNTVILVFFTVTILVFLPFNFLVNEATGLKFYFWLVNIFSLIAFELYLAVSIYKNAKQNKIGQPVNNK